MGELWPYHGYLRLRRWDRRNKTRRHNSLIEFTRMGLAGEIRAKYVFAVAPPRRDRHFRERSSAGVYCIATYSVCTFQAARMFTGNVGEAIFSFGWKHSRLQVIR